MVNISGVIEPWPFALVMARVLGLVWSLSWLAGAGGVGVRGRLAVAAVLSVALVPVVGPGLGPPGGLGAFGVRTVGEALAGAVLGLGAGLIVAAARLAGEIVGQQAGLAAGATLDPGAEALSNPMAGLAGLVALASFAALDGPFAMLMAVAESYQAGSAFSEAVAQGLTVPSAFAAVGDALALALRLAAPVALTLLTAQIALGLLTRFAPALAAWTAWLPARAALGLVLLLAGASGLVMAVSAGWTRLLGGGY